MVTYARARRLLFVALAAWTIAWVLPSVEWVKTLYGWECFRTAVALLSKGWGLLVILAVALSLLTSFLVPIAVFVLDGRRPTGLRRKLPALMIGSFLMNLVYLPYTTFLLVGYYLWVGGFLALGLVIRALLRAEGTEPRSPFVSDGAGGGHDLARGVAVIAIVALSLLVVSSCAGEMKTAETKASESAAAAPEGTTPETSEGPPETSEAAPPAVDNRAGRQGELVQFIGGYTDDVRRPWSWIYDEMASSASIDSCELTLSYGFFGKISSEERTYRIGLDRLSPSSVAFESQREVRTVNGGSSKIEMPGVRLLARDAADVISVSQRTGFRRTEGGPYDMSPWAAAKPVDEIYVGVSKIDPSRVAKAFADLIRLCGGVDEPY